MFLIQLLSSFLGCPYPFNSDDIVADVQLDELPLFERKINRGVNQAITYRSFLRRHHYKIPRILAQNPRRKLVTIIPLSKILLTVDSRKGHLYSSRQCVANSLADARFWVRCTTSIRFLLFRFSRFKLDTEVQGICTNE